VPPGPVFAKPALECRISAMAGSQGVDGDKSESICAHEETANQWLDRLARRTQDQTLRPSPGEGVLIQKQAGENDRLGIPTVQGPRCSNGCSTLLLMPIWEAIFIPHSFRFFFRPKRRAQTTIRSIASKRCHHGLC